MSLLCGLVKCYAVLGLGVVRFIAYVGSLPLFDLNPKESPREVFKKNK
jgi:hypothetical protein